MVELVEDPGWWVALLQVVLIRLHKLAAGHASVVAHPTLEFVTLLDHVLYDYLIFTLVRLTQKSLATGGMGHHGARLSGYF